jgi:hypothetical protein
MSFRAKLWLVPLLTGIPLLWAFHLLTGQPETNDFYPLYFGAQRLLQGLSPYGAEASLALGQQWSHIFPEYA